MRKFLAVLAAAIGLTVLGAGVAAADSICNSPLTVCVGDVSLLELSDVLDVADTADVTDTVDVSDTVDAAVSDVADVTAPVELTPEG